MTRKHRGMYADTPRCRHINTEGGPAVQCRLLSGHGEIHRWWSSKYRTVEWSSADKTELQKWVSDL